MANEETRSDGDRTLTLSVAALACLASCCLVLLDLWSNRNLFDAEGIGYLDMADAYRRGDWQAASVGLWSPLYPGLIALMTLIVHPSAQWEFAAVHALNILIFLATLGSFSFFLREFLRALGNSAALQRPPDWSWVVFGYSLLTWSTIRLVPLHLPEPDLIVCALLYSIFALLLRMRSRPVTWLEAVFLGVLLGLGYLAKGIMFPMAFIFLLVAVILCRRSAPSLGRILISLLVFLAIALPYVVILSKANGRWLFSDAGRLNYAWDVNGVKHFNNWQGDDGGEHGIPAHPTRMINANPPMYEYATPFSVTYPPWYNPSYWYEGVKVTRDLKKQLSVFLKNMEALAAFLASCPGAVDQEMRDYYGIDSIAGRAIGPVLTCWGLLLLVRSRRVSILQRLAENWFIFIPICAVMVAYGLLHFEGRYIAAYVVVLWIVLYGSLTLLNAGERKAHFTAVLALAALTIWATMALRTGEETLREARYYRSGMTEAPFLQSGYGDWKVATYLRNAGLAPGDRSGGIGWIFDAYWARMARLHIVAEVPDEGASAFWKSDSANQDKVMRLFKELGVKAVVGKSVPDNAPPPGWKRIGDTGYYVFLFAGNESR